MKFSNNFHIAMNMLMFMLIAPLMLGVSALPSSNLIARGLARGQNSLLNSPIPHSNTLKVGEFNQRDETAKASVFTVLEYNGHKKTGGRFGENKASMIIRVYDESCTDSAVEAEYTKFIGEKEYMKVLGAGLAPHPDISKDPSAKAGEKGEVKQARAIVIEAIPHK